MWHAGELSNKKQISKQNFALHTLQAPKVHQVMGVSHIDLALAMLTTTAMGSRCDSLETPLM